MRIAAFNLESQPNEYPSRLRRVLVPIIAVLSALIAGALVLKLDGGSPPALTVYREGLDGAFGDWFSITSTLREAIPLLLTAAAASLAFRASLFNIGAEGQLYLGAIGAATVALQLGDDLPRIVVIPLALLAGAAAGALWALLAAYPRARWGTSEILPTLMLNFVALYFLNYLIFGSTSFFRDEAIATFPSGKSFPDAARLPVLSNQADLSVLIGPAIVLVVAGLLVWTRWGFRIRVAGDSPNAARYVGMNISRLVLTVMCASGALAGVAGALFVTGRVGSLEPRSLAIQLGYIGFVVAALSRFSLITIIPVAVLISALGTAAPAIQGLGVPESLVLTLEGLILFFVTIGEFAVRHRVRITRVEHGGSIAPTKEVEAA